MGPIGAWCTHVHTSHLVDRQVIADKNADRASGVIGARRCCLFGSKQNLRQSAAKWNPLGFLSAFFALTAAKLFSYLKNSPSVSQAHLSTAVSIYLLLAYTWAALYGAVFSLYPGSFHLGTDRQSDLLYFSLVTLTTVGYGDVVPLSGEARMLAALEAVTGVLYIAITVAILVSGYRRGSSD